jgi:predicted RNA-binding Zn-ribbon protein involved in translation (DUF1610 family)
MSDGFCEVDFSEASDDADPVEFHDSKTVKARKVHVCDECRGPIAMGESYTRSVCVFEGEFNMYRICAPCREASTEFNYNVFGGLLWEQFFDAWDNGAHIQACIQRLETARAKEHMRQQWLKWQEKRAEFKRRLRELKKEKGLSGHGVNAP